MKIENTASHSGTSRLHDSEVMDDDYQVTFDESDGTVATVRQEVGEALAEKYPGIEVVEDTGPPPDETDDSGADGEQTADNSDNGSDNK